MLFSCRRNNIWANTVLLILPVVALFTVGCQRELGFPGSEQPDTEVWVLKTKKIQGFATASGQMAYITNAAFYYDTVARTLTYRDTSDNQATSEYQYNYNAQGKLVHAAKNLATGSAEYQVAISYNSDSLISKIDYNDYVGIHAGTFQWSRQGANYFGQYTDPSINSAPFSDGNRAFLLNSKKQLIEQDNLSTNPATGDAVLKATLDEKGDAAVTKLYSRKGTVLTLQDSVVYTRESAYPARLGAFNALWGRGIEWFSNDYFISFLVPPVWNTEYYVYINSLTKKRMHYAPDASLPGNPTPTLYSNEEFITEYDADKNPVKHTIFMDGEKLAEVRFTWQKIKWLH